jgi:hypothetical protein
MKNGLKMKFEKEKKENRVGFPFSPDGPAARLAFPSPAHLFSSSFSFSPRR